MQSIEHFVAYHSVKTMGYSYLPEEELLFFSRKLPLLKRAIGQVVWVIQGAPQGKTTQFTLLGRYIAESVAVESESDGLYALKGKGLACVPPVALNPLAWFASLKKSQSNFSLGFNRINDLEVIAHLDALPFTDVATSSVPDVDLMEVFQEGNPQLVSHFRRERSRRLVELKKEQVFAETGRLCCEVCGFDFAKHYGSVGEGYCEVHHLKPLGQSLESRESKLENLAVVCSNCHRMIHRNGGCLEIEDLRKIVTSNKA